MHPVPVKRFLAVLALVLAVGVLLNCKTWEEDWQIKCANQADPQLKPCSCMDPRTLSCPKPPSDVKKPDGGTDR